MELLISELANSSSKDFFATHEMLIRAEWKWKRERRDVQLTSKVVRAVGGLAKRTKCRVFLERGGVYTG